MFNVLVMRTAADLDAVNTVVLRQIPIRFQLAPGTAANLGIAGADYTVSVGGAQVASGTTNADGEVMVPYMGLTAGSVTVNLLGTDYVVTLHPTGLGDAATLTGQQMRLAHLGYMTGYQLDPIASALPDDGEDGARTQQSIMNFQMDFGPLTLDGEVGANTRTKLTAETKE